MGFVPLSNDEFESEGLEVSKQEENVETAPQTSSAYLEKLFQSKRLRESPNVHQKTRYSQQPIENLLPSSNRESAVKNTEIQEILRRMGRVGGTELSISRIWGVCLELDARRPDPDLLQDHRQMFEQLYHRLISKNLQPQASDQSGPQIEDVLLLFEKWKFISPKLLSVSIRGYLGRLISMPMFQSRNSKRDFSPVISSLFSDLLAMWRCYFKHRAEQRSAGAEVLVDGANKPESWVGLPSSTNVIRRMSIFKQKHSTAEPFRRKGPRRGSLKPHFLQCYDMTFPSTRSQDTNTFGSAAALTYMIARVTLEQGGVSGSLRLSAKPFLDTLAPIVAYTNFEYTLLSYALAEDKKTTDLQDYLEVQWDEMQQDLKHFNFGPKQGKPDKSDNSSPPYTPVFRSVPIHSAVSKNEDESERASKESSPSHSVPQDPDDGSLQKFPKQTLPTPVREKVDLDDSLSLPEQHPVSYRIRKAMHERNTKRILDLWRQFVVDIQSSSSSKKWPLDVIYADFMWAFISTGRYEEVGNAWDSMNIMNVEPSNLHWNALLEFSRKTRKWEAAEEFWQEMQRAGIAPDNQAWTTYLGTRLRKGIWKEAIRLVEEMGEAWKQKAQEFAKVPDPAPSQPIAESDRAQFLPSIVPINAVVSGLIALKQHQPAKAVLSWAARSHSLSPDIATYNILLRDAVRASNLTAMRSLIAEIPPNVKPDAITLTVVLDGLVRSPDSNFQYLSPSDQETRITQELDRMFAAGVPATGQTYATLLAALLKGPDPNEPAARIVLTKCTASKIPIQPHIYTMLFMHYFNTSPPNLDALDDLWRRIELEGAHLDHIAYDRMVEGYARLGMIEEMLRFLRRMPEEGKVPGWKALKMSLRALVEREEWGLCEGLVRDVEREGGLLDLGQRGWEGKKEFWGIVGELREKELISEKVEAVGEERGEGEGEVEVEDGGEVGVEDIKGMVAGGS